VKATEWVYLLSFTNTSIIPQNKTKLYRQWLMNSRPVDGSPEQSIQPINLNSIADSAVRKAGESSANAARSIQKQVLTTAGWVDSSGGLLPDVVPQPPSYVY